MLENPLIRFLGSAVALASLPAIEIFGSIEQRPTPTIFMIVFVARVDEILGHDVSCHFQSGEITVKLASHSLDLRSSSFLQGRVKQASLCLARRRKTVKPHFTMTFPDAGLPVKWSARMFSICFFYSNLIIFASSIK